MLELPDHRQTRATRLGDLLDRFDATLQAGDISDLATTATGFSVLDDTIGGGLHAGELMLLGGPPGVGKTIAALQMARNVASDGGNAVYICYEHEEATLAMRLLALEAAQAGGSEEVSQKLSSQLLRGARAHQGLDAAVAAEPGLRAALDSLRSYGNRLTLVRASGAHTAVEQIDELIYTHRKTSELPPVIVVDYLQKVPVHPEPATEGEKVTRTVEALKDLALTHRVPIIGISAVDAAGMDARRLRLHHLRGSSAIAFEADVVIMMNDKHRAVSKVHLAYDSIGAKRFRDWVVFSVEKNRGGPALVDLEFKKDFSRFRFDPDGGLVSERLVDERMDEEQF